MTQRFNNWPQESHTDDWTPYLLAILCKIWCLFSWDFTLKNTVIILKKMQFTTKNKLWKYASDKQEEAAA